MKNITKGILISIMPVLLVGCENLAPGNWYKNGGGDNTEWHRYTDSIQAIHQFDVPLPIESDSLEDVK